jgi:16S rRNA G966 N2-methylase RsmD
MPDADPSLGESKGLGASSGPAFSFVRGALGFFHFEEGAMRFSEDSTLARTAQDHSVTDRDGSGNPPGFCPKLEMLPTEALRPYDRNARTHSRKQLRQIAESIKRFGFCNPVLIDDQRQIIAGHGRVAAAKQLGLSVVPTVRLSHLTEAEKRAYIVADNRLAKKAGWDREILAIELQALIDLDFEVELTGFETAEIDLVLEEAKEASGAPHGPDDVLPAYTDAQAVSRPGDLWVLGPHLLLCGDARSPEAYGQLLGEARAAFVFTDPPYNVPIDGHVCGLGRIRHRSFAMACGEMSSPQFTAFLTTIFRLLVAHSADGSIHQVCMDWRHMAEMLEAGNVVYAELKNLCVWNKSNAGMGSFYRSKHELVFVWKSGTAPHINTFELGQYGRSRSNVWDYAGISSLSPGRLDELAMHPTVKPVALVADAIKDCSRRNDLVLDPFAGSGTVLVAAERTGRRARAIEIDPHYVDVAVKRWQACTGKTAVLSATGETFEEAAERDPPPLPAVDEASVMGA